MQYISKYLAAVVGVLACLNSLIAQPESSISSALPDSGAEFDASSFAQSITAQDIQAHLHILASDEYEGRETGTPGNRKAARYIAGVFEKLGLPAVGEQGTYFQNIAFRWTKWDKISMNVDDQKYRHLRDFVSFPVRNGDADITANEVLFLGYGIDDPRYSDYKGVNVRGKVLLVYKGEPLNKSGISYITGTKKLSDWSNDWQKKLKAARQKGARAILIIDNEIQKVISENRRFLVGPQVSLGAEDELSGQLANNCLISTNIAKDIIGKQMKKVVKARKKIQKKGKPKNVILSCSFAMTQKRHIKPLIGENVLGYIEGTDEKLKEELVIVTAHYDHLGRRGDAIYNGADDNGSGTSTVLDIAEAFTLAKKQGAGPRRSVLVMLVTGEEKGLLGSQYYSERPIFPIANTIANLNVDMIGRSDEKHQDNMRYIYVIGSNRLSTQLHDINEAANKKYTQLELDYTYNAPDDPNRFYYRSDHYNFAQKGIPAIFYFSGTHEDYHRTTDTMDKINFEKTAIIGQLVFYTAWELANRDERIKVDVKPGE